MNQFKGFLILFLGAAFIAGCLPNPLLESGKIAIKERDYERALRNLDSLVALDPNNPEAWFLKGFAHEKLGQIIDMADAYHKSLSLSDAFKAPIDRSAEMFVNRYLARFDTAFDASDWTLAMTLVDSAIIINPSDPVLYHQAAVAALDAKEYDRSLNYALESIKREAPDAKNVRLRSLILRVYTEKNDTDKTIEGAKELMNSVDVNSEDRDLYLQGLDALVSVYEGREMHEQASEVIAAALQKFPDNMLLKQNLAALLLRRHKDEEALVIYREILANDPDNVFANRAVGISLVKLEKYEEGIPYLLKVLEKEPNDQRAMQFLAGAYFNTGQDAKGREYQKRLEADGK